MSKIAVLGASGNFGSALSDKLEQQGHDVVRISRSHGVDVMSPEGLERALDGVDIVVDALHIDALGAQKSIEFFTRAARNVVQAAQANGVGRIVCLSIAGATNPEVNHRNGHYQGKAAQESFYQEADIPSTTVRSSQWFELIPVLVHRVTKGPLSIMPSMLLAPAAMSDVVTYMADLVSEPRPARNEIVAVRGPQVDSAANFARRILAAKGSIDGVQPKTIREAPYLGRGIANGGLIPADAHVTTTTIDEWLGA
ncbi:MULTISPECIES: SDR family oxidoreductase [Kocuria]|uniref:SDR family oxidoreductase n=1 Tax=Kocuria TaxID=57493 RepID=UPI0021A27793|nr:NAD(P)H-binding protein [Kocuria carniphila]MCT1802788.1 NAD(P)H-binding protein [Kocuria carniphila]